MATFFTIERALLEIHQSLGLKQDQTTTKQKFSDGRMQLSGHKTMTEKIFEDIFDALELDGLSRADILGNLMDIMGAYKTVECYTWTYSANERQVLWQLLSHFFVPGIARHVAFWSLEGQLDKGMPGGRFWYLPEFHLVKNEGELYLPVAQVTDWLQDLLGKPLVQFAEEHVQVIDKSGRLDSDSLARSLHNWRKGTTPDWKSIHSYFPDTMQVSFEGAFDVDAAWSLDERFAEALDFVRWKLLSAEALRHEIPMTAPGRLEAVLSGQVDDAEKQIFVTLLAERYGVPTAKLIRQRLLFARMIQDGYKRLLTALCPGVEPLSTNPTQNKVLQLFAIYKYIYNLSVDAYRCCKESGEQAENAWFEEQLPPWDANTLYLSILPSRRQTANLGLAELLSRRFSAAEPEDELEDLIGFDEPSVKQVAMRRMGILEVLTEEARAVEQLVERLQTASPYRTLQAENRYSVIIQVANRRELSPRAQSAALQRLRDLSSSPMDQIQTTLLALDGYLNGERKGLPKDSYARVEALLAEAKANPAYEQWKAPMFQYEAKHHLAMNDFDSAVKLFRQALEAARERGFGSLRGEVARDCFATEVANQRLIPGNHEKYYREMLAGGVVEDEIMPGIEDVSCGVADYFWKDLYKPYPGIECKMSFFAEEIKKPIELLMRGEWGAIDDWIKRNSNKYNKSLHYVTGDSLLMNWIKGYTHFMKIQPFSSQLLPPELQEENQRFSITLEVWKKAIGQLAKSAPKLLNLADFKGQTPLMLVAEGNDIELVRLFLEAGANPNYQDFKGITALHSAVKSRERDCVDALLNYPCATNLMTVDGRTALHTAAWTGNKYAIERLMEIDPRLAWQRDSNGMTPLELMESLIDNPSGLDEVNQELIRQGRPSVSVITLKNMASLLEAAPYAK